MTRWSFRSMAVTFSVAFDTGICTPAIWNFVILPN